MAVGVIHGRNLGATTADTAVMMAYEKLDVYQLSLDFVQQSLDCVGELPQGYAELRSQWKRAAFSVCLNIAEGAGKTAQGHPPPDRIDAIQALR